MSIFTVETPLTISNGIKLQITPISWRPPKCNRSWHRRRLWLRQSFTPSLRMFYWNIGTWDLWLGFGEVAENFSRSISHSYSSWTDQKWHISRYRESNTVCSAQEKTSLLPRTSVKPERKYKKFTAGRVKEAEIAVLARCRVICEDGIDVMGVMEPYFRISPMVNTVLISYLKICLSCNRVKETIRSICFSPHATGRKTQHG